MSIFSSSSALLLFALLVPSNRALAQFAVDPGQRVRITTRGPEDAVSRDAGLVIENFVDSLRVQISGVQRAVPVGSIERLEVSIGRRSRVTSSLIGGGAGLVVGAGLALFLREQTQQTVFRCGPPGTECDLVLTDRLSRGEMGMIAIGTGLIGGTAGLLMPADRWAPAPPRQAGTAISLRIGM